MPKPGVRTMDDHGWDAVFSMRGHCFVLQWKRSGSLGPVVDAIRQLRMAQGSFPHEVIPLLAVPYMGDAARKRCAQAELPWLDLSGNARIIVPGIFLSKPGASQPVPAGPDGRKVRSVPRALASREGLLMEPSKAVRQRVIASGTGLNEGHVSRVAGKLLEAGLVAREADGIRAADPGTLLDAWREEYRFDRHDVIRGHISAGSGESLTHSIANILSQANAPYAATALAAAWLWTRHAGFRLATVYLTSHPVGGGQGGPRIPGRIQGSKHLAGGAQR